MLNLAERAAPCFESAEAYSIISVCMGLAPLRALAEKYATRARASADATGEDYARATVSGYLAVYYTGVGRWGEVRELLEDSMAVFDTLGHRRRWTESACLLSTVFHYLGQFAQRIELASEIFRRACKGGDVQSQAWGLLDQVESLIPLGNTARALALLDESAPFFVAATAGLTDKIWYLGLKASAQYQREAFAAAQASLAEGLTLAARVPPTTVYTMEGYAGFARVALGLFERARSGSPEEVKQARAAAQRARRSLGGFARVMPIAQARSLLAKGLYCSLTGKSSRAMKLWQTGLEVATRLGMPYEQALAHETIAAHCDAGDAGREEHLGRVGELLSECGVERRVSGS
jgi:hypothetical protein